VLQPEPAHAQGAPEQTEVQDS
jgi:hypothetical protein